MSKIAFIVSQFPEMHETFILREFAGFARQGIDFRVFSLKRCRDPIVHPEAEKLLDRVTYSRFVLSLPLLAAQLRWLFRAPGRYFGALVSLLLKNWRDPLSLLKSLVVFPMAARYAEVIRREGIPHVHAHWATIPTTVAMVISRLTGVPYSFTAHAWDIYLKNPTLLEKIEGATFVVTCTAFNKRHLDGLLRSHGRNSCVLVNYHGVELDGFTPTTSPQDVPPLLLSIGRMVEQKGFAFLIPALAMLRDRGYDFRCVIVGSGPERKALERQIRELELEPRVEIVGSRSQEEIKRLYRRATLFVLPCVVARNGDRDGIPNVIVESIAMGLPVISTSVSGVPELVVDGETGLLAPERDAAGLAERIIRLLDDDARRQRMARAGRERIERMFDVDRNVGQLVDYFKVHGALE